MKKILQLEEAILFAACLYLFPYLGLSWWWFAALILTPDIGMAGYLVNVRTGTFTYNLLHHKGVAAAIALVGFATATFPLQVAGYIMFAHACMDRMLGYGLKLESGFKHTHLGMIGSGPHEPATTDE
jgi:hypothetical protein